MEGGIMRSVLQKPKVIPMVQLRQHAHTPATKPDLPGGDFDTRRGMQSTLCTLHPATVGNVPRAIALLLCQDWQTVHRAESALACARVHALLPTVGAFPAIDLPPGGAQRNQDRCL